MHQDISGSSKILAAVLIILLHLAMQCLGALL